MEKAKSLDIVEKYPYDEELARSGAEKIIDGVLNDHDIVLTPHEWSSNAAAVNIGMKQAGYNRGFRNGVIFTGLGVVVGVVGRFVVNKIRNRKD